MGKGFRCLFGCFLFLVFAGGCRKKQPVGPGKEEPLKAIVYGDTLNCVTCPQHDIAWPSLADSPWPMAVVNQQGLSRSKVPVLTQGYITWTIDLKDFNGHKNSIRYGSAVGADGTIYVVEGPSLNAVSQDGKFLWSSADSFEVRTGPIVGNDSTIYCGCVELNDVDGNQGGFIAVRPDGSIKWAIKRSESFPEIRPFMGIDGTIYTRNQAGMLYAINQQGIVIWQKQVAPPVWNIITASPDGSILYLTGPGATLIAIHADTGVQYWDVNIGVDFLHYASIDNQGNIYFYRAPTDSTREIVSIDPDGLERWSYAVDYKHYTDGLGGSPMNGVSIAYNGFLYMPFLPTGVYALDYAGKLRWRYAPVCGGTQTCLSNSRPVICDSEDNLVCFDYEMGLIVKLINNGTILFEMNLADYCPGMPRVGPCAVAGDGSLLVPTGASELLAIH